MILLSSRKHSTLTAEIFDLKKKFELIGHLLLFLIWIFFCSFRPGMKIVLHYTDFTSDTMLRQPNSPRLIQIIEFGGREKYLKS